MNANLSRTWLHDFGLFVIRVMVGVVFMYHGSQKLFGWFDGPGLEGFAGMLAKMQIPYPETSAVLASLAEFVGGLLVFLGLGLRVAVVPLIVTMLVASFKVHWGAFSLQHQGMEYALTHGLVCLGLGLTGPGRFSLDHILLSMMRRENASPVPPRRT